MEFLVTLFGSALVLYIVLYGIFITMPAYGAEEIALCPKLPTPQLFFDRGYPFEYFSGRYALHDFYQARRAITRNRLKQKMHMILFNPDLNKHNFVPLSNFQTYFLKNTIYLFGKYNPPVLGRTYQMIQQYRYVMMLMNIFTHITLLTLFLRPKQASGN